MYAGHVQGEHIANACSSLVAFYAVRLWETTPDVASPSLDVFTEQLQVQSEASSMLCSRTGLQQGPTFDGPQETTVLRTVAMRMSHTEHACRVWHGVVSAARMLPQDARESVRDAAKTLLASCSPLRPGSSRVAAPPQAAALLRLWDGSPSGLSPVQCRQHAAQVGFVQCRQRVDCNAVCSLRYHHATALAPARLRGCIPASSRPICLLVMLILPGEGPIQTSFVRQLIVAAELCRADAAGMPPELLAAVVPSLVTLACSAPEPHSASAATCLAAGMMGRCADAWRVHLGNLQVLTQRCALISDLHLQCERHSIRFSICARRARGAASCIRCGDDETPVLGSQRFKGDYMCHPAAGVRIPLMVLKTVLSRNEPRA